MANSKGCSFHPFRILTNSRLAILILGLFVLAANAMADGVSFDGTTFTGSGEYDEAVNATSNLTVKPDSGGSITFNQNVVTTGQLSQNGEKLVFAAGTENSLGTFFMTNAANNGSSMTLNGSLTTTNFYICNKWTNNVYINEGASLSVSGEAYINQAKNAQGIIFQSGGTVEFTTNAASGVRIGHYPNTGYPSQYNLSGGTFSVLNTTTYVAWDGYAELNISGGTANLKGISLSNSGSARGQLTVTGGTLNLGSGGVTRNARGSGSSAEPIIKLGTATIYAAESHSWGANMKATLNSGTNTTFKADSGKTITINTVLNGDGALTKTGAGTMTLTGANTYTGGTTISEGKVVLSGDGAFGTGNVVNNGTLEFAHTSNKTFENVFSGTGSVTKTGSGTLTLTKRNTYKGGTTISGGRVISKAGNAKASAFGTGAIEVASGATLEFQQSNQLGYDTNAPNDITIKGTLIPSNYTHIKNVTLQNGVIEAEYGYSTSGSGLDFGNRTGSITSTGNSTIKSRININSGAKATINVTSDTLTISGTSKSDGGFTKTGAGTLKLSGANTYTGVTTVSGGTLNITGSAFVSRLVVNSGASATIDSGEDGVLNMPADGYNNSVMIGNGSSGSLTLDSGNVTIRNASNNTGSIQLGTNSDSTVGVLTINGGTMQVDGRILIAANKTGAKGTLTINGGQLTLGVPGAYAESGDPACGNLWFGYGTSAVNLNGGTISLFGVKDNGPKDGSTFNFNGGTLQAAADNDASFLTPMGSMKFYVKQGGAVFDTNGFNVTVSATLEQGTDENDAEGGLTKKGEGTLTLTQGPTYTGPTTVEMGTLALSTGGTLYNLSGGDVDEGSDVIAFIDAAGQALTLNNDKTTKFTGSITADSIEKTGDGTLQICTEANGSIDVERMIVSSGRLDIKDCFIGSLRVQNKAVLSPGNSVGKLTVKGAFTLDSGAALLLEQDETGMDELIVSSYTISPDAVLDLEFTSIQPGATYSLIIQKDGDAAVNFADQYATDAFWNGLLTSQSAYYWNLSVKDNVVYATLDPNAVPEPSTWALLILGAAGLLYVRKRK